MGIFSPNKRRGTEDASDMLRSLLVVFAVVLVVGVYFLFARPHSDSVRVVDGGPALSAARSSFPYHVLAPVGLGPGWRLTSARDTTERHRVVELHLGYLTPRGDYAGVEEIGDASGGTTTVSLGKNARLLAPVTIAGDRWERSTVDGETALVRAQDDGATVIVRGDARLDELVELATSLR
jgi:Protein of unknown function (DUF4245)